MQPGSKIDQFGCKVKYIDRTHLKIDMWLNVTEPVSVVKTRGTFYYKYNTYQRVGGEVRLDICDWLNGKPYYILDWFVSKLLKYTNLNHKCPYDGLVYFRVSNISIDKFTPTKLVPAGRYRIDTSLLETDDRILFNVSSYFSISDYRTDVEYSKI